MCCVCDSVVIEECGGAEDTDVEGMCGCDERAEQAEGVGRTVGEGQRRLSHVLCVRDSL